MSKKTTKPTADYTASVRVLGKTYTATGPSVKEALGSLTPGIARGIGILTVARGDAKKERILSPIRTNRLFNTRGLSRDVELSNISTLFDL